MRRIVTIITGVGQTTLDRNRGFRNLSYGTKYFKRGTIYCRLYFGSINKIDGLIFPAGF
jgi:hypothetical protein